MRGKRPGRPLHGWLAIHKEADMTSARVVERVKRITQAAKAGHGGTLDPFSEGLLPVALGEATKTLAWVLEGDKSYRCWIRFGEETDTGDPTGRVVAGTGVFPTREELDAALPHFRGAQDQVPPAHSALKVDGERAYLKARRGEEVVLESRRVNVYDFLLESYDDGVAVVAVRASKGTYMRALARDLGRRLGCGAHLSRLIRTATLGFTLDQAITLATLEDAVHNNLLGQYLLPTDRVLDGIPALTLGREGGLGILQGQGVWVTTPGKEGDLFRLLDPDGKILAIAELAGPPDIPDRWLCRPKRIFRAPKTEPLPEHGDH